MSCVRRCALHGTLLAGALALTGCAMRSPAAIRAVSPVAAQSASAQQPVTAAATVILISIDGYRADYLQRGLSPNLAALAAGGVRAQWMTPSFPSLTFPNHYTLVTGLYPDHHGIVDNTMEDASIQPDHRFTLSDRAAIGDERWWDAATPLWVSVKQQGGHAATMFWPGSEAPIRGVRPDRWFPFDENVSANARVDHVLAWLDLPSARRPRFITLYFNAVDTAGHHYGPDSAQVDAALRKVDAALGRLIDGLKQRGRFDRVDLVIVSDHGMAPVEASHRIRIDRIANLKLLHPVALDSLASFRPPRDDAATRRAIAALLAPHAHMRCMRKQDIPARFHYGGNPRVPPYVCVAQTGWLIVTAAEERHRKYPMRGEHGYDNADPLMRALFVAHGPDLRSGYIAPPFPNVDVYPLLAHLLRITPEKNDGDYAAVAGMLAPATR